MPNSADRARYWDDRILDWEAARYEGRFRPRLGPMEWVAGWLSGPTRLRQRLAISLAASFIPGKRVIEVGCGTGLLARSFIAAGASGYLGLDHSRVAIEEARRKNAGESRIGFEVRAAVELPAGGELIVSLGLLDWLSDDELRTFFARHGGADFLHTFSELRPEAAQRLHRVCRAVDRLLRPEAVRPRFLSLAHVAGLMPPRRRAPFVHRDPRLRDAAFLSSLPLKA